MLPHPDLKAGGGWERLSTSTGNGEAFEGEFPTPDGQTVALTTVQSSQVRPVTGADITHARELQAGAAAPPR